MEINRKAEKTKLLFCLSTLTFLIRPFYSNQLMMGKPTDIFLFHLRYTSWIYWLAVWLFFPGQTPLTALGIPLRSGIVRISLKPASSNRAFTC